MVSIKESIKNKEAILSSEKLINKEGKSSSDIVNERTIGIISDEDDLQGKVVSQGKEEVDSSNKLFKQLKSDTMIDRSITSTMVKEELREKISLIKNNLMEIIKLSQKDPSTFSNVVQNLDTKFQEFKMFNTINNNYYFLNVPMDMKDKEYDCKLIIKDKRRKGKKLVTDNIFIREKKHDFSFSNCRSFFEDDDFTTINTRV